MVTECGRYGRLALVLLLLVVAGCSRAYQQRDFEGRAHVMLEAGMADIQDVYIDNVELTDLSEAALDGLRTIDPSLEVRRRANVMQISANDAVLAIRTTPQDVSAYTWAGTTAALADQARLSSGSLQDSTDEEIFEAMFNGVVEHLDQYSRYLTAEEASASRADREGFGGIGITIESHPDGALITTVTPGMPAAGAGLLPGDRILAVEDQTISGFGMRKIVRLLRGPVDKPVNIRVGRDNVPEPMDIVVGRTRIVPNTVFYERDGRIAYIRITAFNQRTSKRLAEAIGQAMVELGDNMAGVVLDFRDNPGGLLDQAVDVADLFLMEGRIVSTRGRHPASHQFFEAEVGDIVGGRPIVVLLNGASASAAEIVAAALQDQSRAVVVGTNSFGKGTVQNVMAMPNDGELILTWAVFHAPSGYALDHVGVLPTICTSGVTDAEIVLDLHLTEDPDLARAGLDRRRSLRSEEERDAEAEARRCPWLPGADGDLDRAVARSLLDSPELYRQAIWLGADAGAG